MDAAHTDASIPNQNAALDAILLAAGQGTRMGGEQPKVLFEVADRSMIHWVIDACRSVGVQRVIAVVGYKAELVRDKLADVANCQFVEQKERLGTGHAAMMAEPAFADQPPRDVLVLAGDMPMLKPETLRRLIETHRQSGAAATLATGRLEDPTGYGRIIRDADGNFDRIVEQKDGSAEELAVNEVNPSFYCFRSDRLFDALRSVGKGNQQGEYYLTDVPGILKQRGERVSLVEAVAPDEILGVNTPEQLEQVTRLMQQRINDQRGEESA